MKEPTRILIVEDNAEDADLAKHTLSRLLKECEFRVVKTSRDFLDQLESFQPDVILSDYSLPQFDGMNALKLTLKHAPLTPLIIWTGSISEDMAVACMKAGANNYILKENLKRLGPAVARALEERDVMVARKQAEDALQNSEKRFRALIENGLDDISLLAADGTLIWESPSTIRNLGYAPDMFVGRNIFELMHPEDVKRINNAYVKLLREPGSREHDVFRLRRADGTWRWVEAIVTNMLNEPGVHAMVANYRDVTERKQTEQALRDSQSKYENLVETSHDLIWSVDDEGKFTFINHAAKEIYGYEPEELIGRSFFEIMDPQLSYQDSKKFKEAIARVNEFKRIESYVRHRDGRQIILSTNSIVLRDEQGNIVGVAGSSHDITERKQAEIELQQRNDDLALTNALNEAINRGEDLDAVVGLMTKEIKHMFSGQGVTIYLLNPDGQSLKMQQYFLSPATRRKIEKLIRRDIPLIDIPIQEGGHFHTVLQSGRGMITSDPQAIQKWMGEFVETSFLSAVARVAIRKLIPHIYDLLDIKSTMLIPLISDEKTVGLLDVSSPDLFTAEDLKRIENLGRQLTIAIGRKQAEIELKQRNDDLGLINSLNEVINRGEDMNAVVHLLWDETKRIFSSEYTTIYILNPDGQSIKMQEFFLPPQVTKKIEKLIGRAIPAIEIPIQEGGFFQSVLRAGHGMVTSDPKVIQSWIGEFVETRFLPPAARVAIRRLIPYIYKLLSIKSTLLVPLISGGRTLGFLNVSGSQVLTEQDLKRIEHLGGQLTNALWRKQVEENLQEERNLLRTLIDHLPDRIYAMDIQGRKTLSNTADWKASGGKTMAEVIGKTDFDTYPPELAVEFWKLDKAVLDSGEPVINFEEPGLDADANMVSVLTTKIPLRDHEGKVTGLVGVGRDITERKQVEKRINDLLAFNEKILNHSPMGILTYKSTGECVFANENAALIVGTSVEELKTQNFNSIETWKKSGLDRVVSKAITTQAAVQADIHHFSSFGKEIWMTVHCVTFKSKDEDHILMSISDITERKQSEIERQVFLEIMQGLADTSDLQELLTLIHVSIAKMIYAANFFVILYQQKSGLFEEIYSVDQYDPPQPPSKLEKSITSYVFRSGEPLLLTQERFTDLEAQGEVELVGTNSPSWLGVPLKASGRTIGVMVVQDYENDNRYSERDRDFLASIATQAALAIERRQADEALRASEEDYRAIFEGVQDAIFVESVDGRILMVNQRACEMFGYSRAEFLTKMVSDLVPENRPILTIDNTDVSLSVEPRETFNQRANGEIFPIEISGRPQVINGETIHLVVVRDITERKRAEDLLQDSEERFSNAFEYASIGMALVALDGQWLRVNWALVELLGYSAEELLQKTFQDITHPKDLESDLGHVHQLLEGEIHSYQMEKRYFHKLGHILWVLLSVSLVRDHEGRPLYFLSQIQDITERKRAEAAEREQRVLAQALLDTAETLSSTLDYGQVLDHILNAVGRVVPHDAATIMLIEGESARVVRSQGYDKHDFNTAIMGVRLPLAETVNLRQMLETKQPVVVYDTHVYPSWKRMSATDWLRSSVGAPISIHGEVIGFICLDGQPPEFFTPVHAKHLEAFANQAALAIHNARLLQQAQDEIADRKFAEQALRESEALYRQAIEVAGAVPYYESYYDDGASIKYEFIGEGIRQITGYGPEEFNAGLWDSLVEEVNLVEDLKGYSLEEGILRVRSGENPIWKCEHRIRDRDGKIHWVFEAAVEVRDENGISHGSIGTYQDITIRKQAEDTLRESEQRYRALFEDSPVSIWEEDFSHVKKYLDSLKQQGITDFRAYFASHPGAMVECARLIGVLDVNNAGLHMYQAESKEDLIKSTIQALCTGEQEHNHEDFIAIAEGKTSNSWEGADETIRGEPLDISLKWSVAPGHEQDFSQVFVTVIDITEQKRVEENLRTSNERFNFISKAVNEAVWDWDLVAGQVNWNDAIRTLFNYRLEEVGMDANWWMENIHPDDREKIVNSIHSVVDSETTNHWKAEYRYRRADGSYAFVFDRGYIIRDTSEKAIRMVGAMQDITERKQAEQELRDSEERFRQLADNIQEVFWMTDAETGQELYMSPAGETIWGRPSEFLLNEPDAFINSVLPEDQTKVLQAIEMEKRGEKVEMEYRIARPDGSVRWIWDRAFPIFDDTGSVKRIAGISADITERKRADQQLRKLSRAVEQSSSTIIITDTAGVIEYVNPKFTEITGYSYEEAMGQNPRILKSGLTLSTDYEQLWKTIASGREWHGELQNRKKGGELYWEWVTISPILNERREITHFVGIKDDITQRKQSEIETRRHIAELEALYENGLAVGRLLKPAEIGDRIINTFARYLPWHHVTIRLRREDSDELELVAFNLPSLKEGKIKEAEQHFVARINKVGQGLSGWAIQTGQPLRTGNVHTHPQYIDTHAGIQSGLYMPMRVGEQVIGVISVESEAADVFTEQDERLLATLANQAAIAFENSRLYEAIQNQLLERKRAEEALRVSETHYRELADSITDILFELDQDMRYTHWNKASEIITGVASKDAVGRSMSKIFGTPEEQIRIGTIYDDVLKSRHSRTFETTLWVNEQKRAFEVNAYPSTRGISVVAKDVTDRKRSEIILQKRFELMEFSAHHTLHKLMQKAVDEVSELTGSTIGFFHFIEADQTTLGMQTWSTNALQLFNVPLSAGTHLPLNQAGVWAEAARQRHPLIQNDVQALANTKDMPHGHVSIAREMVIPIIRNERIMAVMGVGNKPQDYSQHDLELAARLADYAWDVTERKQMELALEAERQQLARRVDERTADLSRANSNLARALRVKDEFLANMSHELRTPLNAILGLSESLAEQIAGPLNEKQQKYIGTIGESGHHLLSLINDILDLAKIEAGQITLDINKVDIRAVCQASLRMIKQLAQKKNQEVSLEIDDGLGLMWADERRLKQMIVNLLGNAVKFTPENGKLGLEVHGNAEANQVTITVWDHGIGIKEDDLARLFQPFVQLDSGLAREAQGTGLGLALVAQMARLHGGSVNAISELGKGSRFSIIVPWEPALAIDAATRMRITGKFRAIKFDETNRPTILVVEDTKEVTLMLKDYLETAGYKVVTAQDGVDAIGQAKLVRPDLILMDVQMPRMDGMEATRKLRSDPDFKYTPIIALTALAMPNDRERCLEAGMDEYISKPVNLKALVKIIQTCLINESEAKPQ